MKTTYENTHEPPTGCTSFQFSLIETTNQLIWCVDEHYCFLGGNVLFHSFLLSCSGTSIKRGESILPFQMFSLSMAEWKEYYDKVLSEAKSISIETESNINAGKEHFEIHLNPVFNEKRDITAVSAIAYNISKQRYLEKQLTQSNELLRQNELITLTGSWEWDIQNQTMFWTDQVFRIHDIEPANIEPGSKERIIQSLSCYFPTDQPIIIEAFQNC
jgi:hypothetical protein